MAIYKPNMLDKFKDFVIGLRGNADELENTQNELVSHKAESASKHIKESGTNEKGNYIKFDDGTLIQYSKDIILNFGSTSVLFVNWSFPARFIDSSYTVTWVAISEILGASENLNLFHHEVKKHSGGYCGLQARAEANTFSSENTMTVNAAAIGRWKE